MSVLPVATKRSVRFGAMRGACLLLGGLFAMFSMASCAGESINACSCFLCDAAVILTVTDEVTGDSIPKTVQYSRDGVDRGSANCDIESTGACEFGDVPGVYHMVVTSEGYEPREVRTRIGIDTASERCCTACARGREVDLMLSPRQ